jgi:ribosome-binding factor A
MSKRTERVADLIRRELADILLNKMRDPRLGFVSVTGVEVTGDLSSARVYLSSLAGSANSNELLAMLRKAAPFLRHELAPRLGLREVPNLAFTYDASIERGARVEELLRKLHDGEVIEDTDVGPDAADTGVDDDAEDDA